jgi:hypothetical protein
MDIALAVAAYIVLSLAALAGLVLAFVGFPGTWVILAGFLLGNLIHPGPNHYGAWAAVAGLALTAEAAEWVMGYFGMRKFGVSRKSAWGAVAGSFVGAFAGVAFPVPVLGSLIGALAGAFIGAFLVEVVVSSDTGTAVKSGLGGLLGRLAGIFSKTLFAAAMVVVAFYTLMN